MLSSKPIYRVRVSPGEIMQLLVKSSNAHHGDVCPDNDSTLYALPLQDHLYPVRINCSRAKSESELVGTTNPFSGPEKRRRIISRQAPIRSVIKNLNMKPSIRSPKRNKTLSRFLWCPRCQLSTVNRLNSSSIVILFFSSRTTFLLLPLLCVYDESFRGHTF